MNILLFVPAIVWLLISATFFAAGEYLSKMWGINPSLKFALLVALVYSIGSLFWLPTLLHKNQLIVMGTIWIILATLSTIIIGFLIFHEKLTLLQWTGVILSFIALLLIGSS
jgi:multidrug transporter EmrE-like cation transporter